MAYKFFLASYITWCHGLHILDVQLVFVESEINPPRQCGGRAAQSEKLFCSAKERAVGSGLRYAASVRGSAAATRPVAFLGATPPGSTPTRRASSAAPIPLLLLGAALR